MVARFAGSNAGHIAQHRRRGIRRTDERDPGILHDLRHALHLGSGSDQGRRGFHGPEHQWQTHVVVRAQLGPRRGPLEHITEHRSAARCVLSCKERGRGSEVEIGDERARDRTPSQGGAAPRGAPRGRRRGPRRRLRQRPAGFVTRSRSMSSENAASSSSTASKTRHSSAVVPARIGMRIQIGLRRRRSADAPGSARRRSHDGNGPTGERSR